MYRWPPHDVDDIGLWNFLVAELVYHRGNRPHKWIDTLNRLWRKNRFVSRADGTALISDLPLATTENISIHEEKWPLSRLQELLHPETHKRDSPLCDSCPILILFWKDRYFLIDGTTRINRRVRDADEGPHRTIIIKVHSGAE